MNRPAYDLATIAAIATPPGYGGIGVIRLSGPASLSLLQRFFPVDQPHSLEPNRATLRQISNPENGILIDEVIITYFKAPHSFTGEDVVEISCHGSPIVLSEVLRLLLSFGAKAAEPGEFSLRAFLNGRLDLTQAEAVHDLIHAQTGYQAQLAARQLRGELSRQLQPIKQRLINLIVYFESSVEFVEDDLDALDLEKFAAELDDLCAQLRRLASSYQYGRVIRTGLRLALIGRPNVGKSSLFNALIGRDRAIVTSIPGTTRDALSEVFAIQGIPVELVDTAGLRETEDLVEQLGVERTRTAISDADLVVAVFDAISDIDDDLAFLDQFPIHFCILNKCDLGYSEGAYTKLAARSPTLRASALTGAGIDQIKDYLHERIAGGIQPFAEGAIITSERHYAALTETLKELEKARIDLQAGFTEEIALFNLHAALRNLGVITGETLIADLINQIFSTFCIGK
jgi:tRNA modification GTPase